MIRGLKISWRKKEVVARVFAASENFVKPIKTAVEVEADLKIEYLAKLKIDDRNIPDPFKIPHGWMNEDQGMKFWPMLLYPDIFNYLMFFPSELGRKDLNDYKFSKAYSYHKSGWLQPLLYHNLTGSNFYILKDECKKSQKVRQDTCTQCTCIAGMSETCIHVAAEMFQLEAAVRTGLLNPSCTSSSNEWLPCGKDIEPTKSKDLNFDRGDFAQRSRSKRPLVPTPKKKFNPLAKSDKKPLSLIDFT